MRTYTKVQGADEYNVSDYNAEILTPPHHLALSDSCHFYQLFAVMVMTVVMPVVTKTPQHSSPQKDTKSTKRFRKHFCALCAFLWLIRFWHKILKDSATLFVHCVCLYGTAADQVRTGMLHLLPQMILTWLRVSWDALLLNIID